MSITMGSEIFIYYIRKQYPGADISNQQLGKLIWEWIHEHDAEAEQVVRSSPCLWDEQTVANPNSRLPKTACQFLFDRALLPALFDYLDELTVRP
jgi:hypothetical protein